jgi:hypothetical protein
MRQSQTPVEDVSRLREVEEGRWDIAVTFRQGFSGALLMHATLLPHTTWMPGPSGGHKVPKYEALFPVEHPLSHCALEFIASERWHARGLVWHLIFHCTEKACKVLSRLRIKTLDTLYDAIIAVVLSAKTCSMTVVAKQPLEHKKKAQHVQHPNLPSHLCHTGPT